MYHVVTPVINYATGKSILYEMKQTALCLKYIIYSKMLLFYMYLVYS